MRFWLVCLALIIVGCTPTGNSAPTPRGPIVPTRNVPTPTDTQPASETPAASATFTATTLTPSETPAPTEVALLPSATDMPTEVASETAAPSVTPAPTDAPSATATDVPTDLPSPTATNTDVPPTLTFTPSVTNTVETPTPSPTNTVETPTPSPTDTPAPTETPMPTVTPDFEPRLFSNSTASQPVMVEGELTLETPVNGSIDDDHPAVVYTYQATAGEVIDARLSKVSGNLDPFLVILDPKGREIARNDDVEGEGDDVRDSAIHIVTLAESGQYAFVATRFGQAFGTTSGDFELVMGVSSRGAAGTFSTPTGYETSINATLDDETPERVYTFRGAAGDIITIQMTTTSGDLDPNITLTDNTGTVLAQNDDNLVMGVFDSIIQSYILPRTGYYSVIARRYSSVENSGDFRLKIAREGQTANRRFALLNTINSGIVSEEGTLYSSYSLGDEIDDEDGREHSYQGLLTFELPPADAPTIENATFAIAPCYERGGGWDTLGALTTYVDNYGVITETRNITRPLPGARILNTQTDCTPLDVTELVQNAYDTGDTDIQLRLIFRDRENNGETDMVLTTPSLVVTFAQ